MEKQRSQLSQPLITLEAVDIDLQPSIDKTELPVGDGPEYQEQHQYSLNRIDTLLHVPSENHHHPKILDYVNLKKTRWRFVVLGLCCYSVMAQ